MDWGIELWDQFEAVDKHHQHQIDFAEKCAKFVKERCAIEMDYASRLRKLVKSNQPKKKDEDRNIYSNHKAFHSQLLELSDVAGQHETVAEEMISQITRVLLSFCNELKTEKKKLYQDGRKQQDVLDQHERALEQTKKKFEKEWKDCERAHAYFEKLDADINVTKIDVEKAKHAWMAKKDSVESCKTDYGAALQYFNKEQDEHYTIHMPKLFQAYKENDSRLITKCKELLMEYAKIDMKVKPLIQKCLEEMEKAASSIDAEQDAQLVIGKLKSGFSPPGDKEFEDFTQPQHNNRIHSDSTTENSLRNSANLNKVANKKGGLSWMFGKKKVVESPDYSHLPPEQRRKKLQKIINELKKDINKEEEGKKAIQKMQEVYTKNSALGDPDSLAGQMKLSQAKIDKLQADLAQHESWYADAAGSVQPSSRANAKPARPPSSYEKPAAVAAAPSSVPAPPPAPVAEASAEPAPEVQAEPEPDPEPQEVKQNNEATEQTDEFDEEPEPIGTCTALFDFEANSEGALSMKAGEKFSIIEADGGDGWTRAMHGEKDGYVPTSYLEVNFF